jgi:hypothetical protein
MLLMDLLLLPQRPSLPVRTVRLLLLIHSLPKETLYWERQDNHPNRELLAIYIADDRYNFTTSPSFPILANSPSLLLHSLPDNLDQVVAGHVIDNIINVFFDYVRIRSLALYSADE